MTTVKEVSAIFSQEEINDRSIGERLERFATNLEEIITFFSENKTEVTEHICDKSKEVKKSIEEIKAIWEILGV